MTIADEAAQALGFAADSLEAYIIAQWPGFVCKPHHREVVHTLEAVQEGRLDRVMINMPPRHGKSEICSRAFPAHSLGLSPEQYIIGSTYNQEFANGWGRKVRDWLSTDVHKATFPKSRIRRDARSVKEIVTTAGGAYFAVGAGSSATGRGAHKLLIDDPYKSDQEANSEVIRERVKTWFQSVATTRLMPGGAIVIVQTRWHEDDLTGWQLEEHADEKWHVVNLPAIAEENDLLGRVLGEPLWPEAYDEAALARIRKALGPYFWEALYQQRPTSAGGTVFKEGWFKKYYARPDRLDRIIISIDCSFKDTDGTDYVVVSVWGAAAANFFLLDLVRDRMSFSETVRVVEEITKKWPEYSQCYIEDKANGPAVIDQCKKKVRRLVAVEPVGSKQARAYAVQGLFEAGNVLLPAGASWLPKYINELKGFPRAKHDDQVDSTTQALLKLDAPRRPNGLMPTMILGV